MKIKLNKKERDKDIEVIRPDPSTPFLFFTYIKKYYYFCIDRRNYK